MMRFLKRLWQKFVIPFDSVDYEVSNMTSRDYERVDEALSSLPSVNFGFGDLRLNVAFLPECIEESQIRATLEQAGFDVQLIRITRADRA